MSKLTYAKEDNLGTQANAFFAREYECTFNDVTFTIAPTKMAQTILPSSLDLIRGRFIGTGTLTSVRVQPKTVPMIPNGWPPDEEPASVVDADGVRPVRDPRHPQGGTPMNDEMRAYMKEWHPSNWKCCVCGTCNPADPCIPGAYF